MNKLAQDYTTTLKIYPGLKKSLSDIYTDAADNTLYVQIRASGFFILSRHFSDNNSFIIDIKAPSDNKQKGLKLATINLRDKLGDEFDKNVQILSIEPDTIFFNISDHIFKKVPVTGNFDLSFKNEFRQYAPIQFFPDSVTVTGSRKHISKINSIVLPSKKYDNLEKTVEDISIISNETNISVKPAKIRYKIPVERCTEGTVSIAVKTVNVPRKNKLVILPAKVNIKYLVPLKDYNSVSENDFFVQVDFKDTETSLNRHVKVNVVRHPSSVFDIKVEPAFVEFLIQK
jgi:YbbR domain-containing protein